VAETIEKPGKRTPGKVAKRPPAVGSAAWEEAARKSPQYIRETLLSLTERAEGGDKEAAEVLFTWLKEEPGIRPMVRGLEDLAIKIERVWVDRHSGTDELRKGVLREEIEAMRTGLLGTAPSIVEKLLASTVVVAHLSFQQASAVAASKASGLGEREARERQLSMAQKRLIAAVKAWEQISGKKAAGLGPRGQLGIFEPLAS